MNYGITNEQASSLGALMEKLASDQRRERKIRAEARAREIKLLAAHNAAKKAGHNPKTYNRPVRTRIPPKELAAQADSFIKGGGTDLEFAEKVGMAIKTIRGHLRDHAGYKFPVGGKKEVNPAMRKKAESMRKAGKFFHEIAKELGVCSAVVRERLIPHMVGPGRSAHKRG